MKKRVFVVAIFLFLCSILYSKPQSFKLGIGNDIWTFGFSQNNDDQLSFSSRAEYVDSFYTISLSLDAITNRGWKEDWTRADLISGRYDVISLDFSFNNLDYQKDLFYFSFEPLVGFAFSGNLWLDKVQNFLHGNTSIPKVDIPYEEGNNYSPRFGGTALIGIGFPVGSNSSVFKTSIALDCTSSLFLETEANAFMSISVENEEKAIMAFNFGYKYLKGHTDWMTQKFYHDFLRGWFLGFDLNLGLLSLDYQTTVGSRIGYCTYSIDVLSAFKDSVFKAPDFTYSIMYSYVFGKSYHEAEIYKEIGNSNFSLGFNSRYFSADPIKGDLRKRSSSSSYYSMLYYSFDYGYLSSWIVPYISLGVGFSNFAIITYHNMQENASKPFDKVSNTVFSMDIAVGLTVFPPFLLDCDNASYSLKLKGGIIYHPNSEVIKEYLSMHSSGLFDYAILPYFSVGINIAIDL